MKNKTQFYNRTIAIIRRLLVAVFLWVSISCALQRLKCPQMTETELLLYIPHSFLCDWKHCN
jgi:hypothetical protein